MGAWRGVMVLGALALAACGYEDRHRAFFHDDSKDRPEFSAVHLGDGFEDDSAADFLNPTEKEAVEKSRVSDSKLEMEPGPDGSLRLVPAKEPAAAAREPQQEEGFLDRAGKVSVSVLGVGLSLAAAAAPFLLF
jgi:hypothetical protein